MHRRPYRETSLVLECLTAEAGRVGLVAKGARRGGRHARLEPLHEYELAWVGRGELHTLTSAEPRRRVALQGEAAICALYVNELLLRLLARDDPHPAIYPAYWRCLDALDDGNADLPRVKALLKDIPNAEQLTGAAWAKAGLQVTCTHGCE